MKTLSLSKFHSLVGVFLCSTILFALQSEAQVPQVAPMAPSFNCDKVKAGDGSGFKDVKDCVLSTVGKNDDNCESAAKEVKDALQKRQDACAKSRLGADCSSRAQDCQDELMDEDVAMPDFFGGGIQGVASKCPTDLGSDVKSEADTLKRDFDSKKKEAATLQKEMLDKEAQSKKDIADLNKQLAELDESKSKNAADLEKEQLQNKSDARHSLTDLTNSLADMNTQILDAEGAKAENLAKKAKELASLSDGMIKLTCETEVRTAIEKSGAQKSGSANSLIKRFGKQNGAAKEAYLQCYNSMLADRKGIVEKYNGIFTRLDDEINKSNQKMQQMQTELKEMEAASAQQEALFSKQKNDQEAKYQQDRQNLIQQIYDTYEGYQKYQQTSQQQLAELQQEINKSSNELSMIGQKPKGNTATVDEVMAAQSTFETTLSGFTSRYCSQTSCEESKSICNLDKEGKAKSSSSPSGAVK